jgi:hypothetical protein
LLSNGSTCGRYILVANSAASKTLQVLAETPILAALTEKQLTDLAGQVKLIDIDDAPSVVHMSGSRVDGFYIVLEVGLYKLNSVDP